MKLSFAVNELGLYLNIHSDDKEALTLRNNYVRMLRDAVTRYEKEIGPLTSATIMENGYTWINDPWPWDEQEG